MRNVRLEVRDCMKNARFEVRDCMKKVRFEVRLHEKCEVQSTIILLLQIVSFSKLIFKLSFFNDRY